MYFLLQDTNSMNKLITSMYKQSGSQPSSRNPSAPSSPYHPTEGQNVPGLDHTLFTIDRQGTEKHRSRPSSPKSQHQSPVPKLVHSFSATQSVTIPPSSPAGMLSKTEEANTECSSNTTTSASKPFTLASKQQRLVSMALNREGASLELPELGKDMPEESSPIPKQKGDKRKSREGTPEVR